VEIALVAEDVDAAHRIAVDAGCEQLAPPTDKQQGQRVGYVRDPVRDAGRARHAAVEARASGDRASAVALEQRSAAGQVAIAEDARLCRRT
jgi:hypothetical protein